MKLRKYIDYFKNFDPDTIFYKKYTSVKNFLEKNNAEDIRDILNAITDIADPAERSWERVTSYEIKVSNSKKRIGFQLFKKDNKIKESEYVNVGDKMLPKIKEMEKQDGANKVSFHITTHPNAKYYYEEKNEILDAAQECCDRVQDLYNFKSSKCSFTIRSDEQYRKVNPSYPGLATIEMEFIF